MKKNSGFTLIEMLIVIVVIGIILSIVIPKFIKTIDNSNEKLKAQTIETIERAAYNYVIDNQEEIGYDNNVTKSVYLDKLLSLKYINANSIIDPTTHEQLNGRVLIIWEDENNNYRIEFEEMDSEELGPR